METGSFCTLEREGMIVASSFPLGRREGWDARRGRGRRGREGSGRRRERDRARKRVARLRKSKGETGAYLALVLKASWREV